MRIALLVASVLVTLFGALCLNYTTDGKAAHHREEALEHGWPPPSDAIFLLGVVTTIGGAGLGGFVLGRGRKARA